MSLPPGEPAPALAAPETGPRVEAEATVPPIRVVNLIRVPGSQQVLLKVRVAELNRTAMRQIGANFLGVEETIFPVLAIFSDAARGIVIAQAPLFSAGEHLRQKCHNSVRNPLTTFDDPPAARLGRKSPRCGKGSSPRWSGTSSASRRRNPRRRRSAA